MNGFIAKDLMEVIEPPVGNSVLIEIDEKQMIVDDFFTNLRYRYKWVEILKSVSNIEPEETFLFVYCQRKIYYER